MKSTKSLALILVILSLVVALLSGCNPADSGTGKIESSSSPEGTPPSGNPNDSEITIITLNGNDFAVTQKGAVTADGNVLTIVKAGTYKISGTLDNAQLRVCVSKTERVDLIFAGVSITNTASAPLYIESADKVSIELQKDTVNTFTDAKTYVFPEGTDKPNACIYSSEDLTIKGEGSLTVNAYYNNGIGSKNDLKIKSGNVTVNAANNALKGNQSVIIEGGNITLKGSDGIKSDSIVEEEGIVQILAGNVNITAGDDGIQAVTKIDVSSDAKVTINAADDDINCDGTINVASGAIISK